MKHYITIIAHFMLSGIGFAQFFTIHELSHKNQFEHEYSIPLLVNDSLAHISTKINNQIQKAILGSTHEISGDSIFQLLNENGMYGTTNISYKVTRNSETVFSIVFNTTSMTSYEDYHNFYLNFNSKTGETIEVQDLFSSSGIKWLTRRIKHLYTERVKEDHKERMSSALDSGRILSDQEIDIFFRLIECVNNTKISKFCIQENKITFSYPGGCFPRVLRAGEINWLIDLRVSSIPKQSMFTTLGMKIFFNK